MLCFETVFGRTAKFGRDFSANAEKIKKQAAQLWGCAACMDMLLCQSIRLPACSTSNIG